MLRNAENGFDDIISLRSKYIKENNIDIQSLKYSELEQMILENPSILKRPIIIDDDKMQVGYNEEDIYVFSPKELREAIMCMNCSSECGYEQILKQYLSEVKEHITK